MYLFNESCSFLRVIVITGEETLHFSFVVFVYFMCSFSIVFVVCRLSWRAERGQQLLPTLQVWFSGPRRSHGNQPGS